MDPIGYHSISLRAELNLRDRVDPIPHLGRMFPIWYTFPGSRDHNRFMHHVDPIGYLSISLRAKLYLHDRVDPIPHLGPMFPIWSEFPGPREHNRLTRYLLKVEKI